MPNLSAPKGVTFNGQKGTVDLTPNAVTMDQRVWNLRDAIYEKVNPGGSMDKPMMDTTSTFWVRDLYDTYAILCKDGKFYQLPYSVDAEGNVQVGDMTEVEHFEGWKPVVKSVILGCWMEPEVKAGKRNAAADVERLRKIQAILAELLSDEGEEDKPNKPDMPMEGKTLPEDELLVSLGSEIKSLGETDEGVHVGGKLVRFSDQNDTDLTGDFFDAKTDFSLEKGERRPIDIYFHHTMPLKSANGQMVVVKQKIGKGVTFLGDEDDPGVLIDAIIWNRKAYEKAIAGQLKSMGWSSGTASHLVTRTPAGKAQHIDRWPIGADATATPIPADYKNHLVLSIKSLDEMPSGFIAAELTANADADNPQVKEFEMDEKEMKTLASMIAEAVGPAVAASVKAVLPEKPVDGTPTPTPPAAPQGVHQIIETKTPPVTVAEHGDDNDGMKAMRRFIRTGEIPHDLRPDVGYKFYPAVEDVAGVKTTYNWTEGGTYDGYALVPPEYWATIVQKRYEPSIFRKMGCQVFPTGSNKVMIPAEYTREPVFVKTTEATGLADQTTTEPVKQKELDIFMYTRRIPVSIQLINDSVYPIESYVASRAANALALTENSLFTVGSGDGATDIEGVMVGGTAGLTLAGAAAIAQGEVEKLFYALPSYYQAEAVWGMRNATLGKIRAITGNWFAYQPTPSGQTAPMPGNAGGSSGELQYKPVFLSDYFAAVAASAKSFVVGNPQYYGIAENQGMMIQRNPYDSAGYALVNFYCYVRFGGGVLQSEAWQYASHPSA